MMSTRIFLTIFFGLVGFAIEIWIFQFYYKKKPKFLVTKPVKILLAIIAAEFSMYILSFIGLVLSGGQVFPNLMLSHTLLEVLQIL